MCNMYMMYFVKFYCVRYTCCILLINENKIIN